MDVGAIIARLNAPEPDDRLTALAELRGMRDRGRLPDMPSSRDVNNHIHTTYSFSPYSPTKAVWMADQAGLVTAGLMDHDTIAGAREFIQAGRIVGLPTTIGSECRASFAATPLNGRKINNPDQDSVAYVAIHGIPHHRIDAVAAYFAPLLEARGRRNQAMTARLAELLQPLDLSLDYDRDVLPLSQAAQGGSVTERHLLYAVAVKLLDRFKPGPELIDGVRLSLGLPLSQKVEAQLGDPDNPFLDYDLLGVLKSHLVERIYIDAAEECPPIAELSAFVREIGAILAYAYLGDVNRSVTGDKKAQQFEDSYLDELFDVLSGLGFQAVTYMPSRNTRDQLERVRDLCERYGLFQISGEDINQPRQSFVCVAMRDPVFANLYDAAWALIGHEEAATANPADGMFTAQSIARQPLLADRVASFRDAALARHGRIE